MSVLYRSRGDLTPKAEHRKRCEAPRLPRQRRWKGSWCPLLAGVYQTVMLADSFGSRCVKPPSGLMCMKGGKLGKPAHAMHAAGTGQHQIAIITHKKPSEAMAAP